MITLLILNALFIIGLEFVTQYELKTPPKDGNVFGSLDDIGEREILWFYRWGIGSFVYTKAKSLKWVLKPLFMCTVCMSSVYGSLAYWLASAFTVHNLLVWPLYVVALAGLVRVTNSFTR